MIENLCTPMVLRGFDAAGQEVVTVRVPYDRLEDLPKLLSDVSDWYKPEGGLHPYVITSANAEKLLGCPVPRQLSWKVLADWMSRAEEKLVERLARGAAKPGLAHFLEECRDHGIEIQAKPPNPRTAPPACHS